jgi:anti-sigma factor RsiW
MAELNDQERAELVAYLDGELDPEAARALEARLGRDPRVRAEAEALTRTWDLLDYLPKPTPSAAFTHRTLERLSGSLPAQRPPSRRRPWPQWAAAAVWAAAVLMAAGAGWGVARWQSAGRADRARAALEEEAARHLHVIENQSLFANVDDLAFLRALDQPDLFGEDETDSETE